MSVDSPSYNEYERANDCKEHKHMKREIFIARLVFALQKLRNVSIHSCTDTKINNEYIVRDRIDHLVESVGVSPKFVNVQPREYNRRDRIEYNRRI